MNFNLLGLKNPGFLTNSNDLNYLTTNKALEERKRDLRMCV